MPSFFQKVLADAKGLEEEVLGPDYKYTDYIKSPKGCHVVDDFDEPDERIYT